MRLNLVLNLTTTRVMSLSNGQIDSALSCDNESTDGPDIIFQGGVMDLYGSSQQFTAQRLKFDGCTIGVHLIWNWGWVWKSITMNSVDTGFKLVPDNRTFATGEKGESFRRYSTLVDNDGAYFERFQPQYEDRSVGDFIHVKDLGAKGDGNTDDTTAFQAALYSSLGTILFVDAGSCTVTSTVTVLSGAKIVGETWSQLAASGSYFEDALHPKVMLKVGTKGQLGDVEMQNLFLTTVGATAGAIWVE
ncbi:hypothetical protein G6011_04005 [Alternaria panax]|uniref:Rhamnogalacturonase A/B/Epimerase-like pectate lyase domain-containing protein n=1 Tax=Alternaria panax TaxID=48097 RepID=A0AAD4IGC1_9PLEO|nr:hypothetical protein G6011_04005 [Alternaria panax]